MKTEINKTTFSRLMAKAVPESESLLEGVCYQCNMANFTICFDGRPEDDFKLGIWEFGKETKKGWIEMKPTTDQIEKMQNMIYDKVYELREEALREELEEMENNDNLNRYGYEGAIYGKWY